MATAPPAGFAAPRGAGAAGGHAARYARKSYSGIGCLRCRAPPQPRGAHGVPLRNRADVADLPPADALVRRRFLAVLHHDRPLAAGRVYAPRLRV